MRIWLRRLIVLVISFELLRLLFWWLNSLALASVSLNEKLLSLILGLRYDFAVIATINVPLMALHSIRLLRMPDRYRNFIDHAIGFLFVIVNLPLIAAGVVDAKIFAFTGRRMTLDFFAMGTDIQRQGLAILLQYWMLTVAGLSLCGALIYVCWQRDHYRDTIVAGRTKGHHFLRGFLFIAVSFLAIRGGVQTKPLVPAHAYSYQPAIYANLILNSGITLLRTPPSTPPKRYTDFPDETATRRALTPTNTNTGSQLPLAPGKNIVIIIVESLGSEYVGALNEGKGYTPFIDSLMPKSVSFKDSFANGRRSIDALPAIFASIPAWRDQPFVTSPFNSNNIQALPNILKKHGYESFFFHGAANGSMHFDSFSAMAGIDHYIGLNEYPSQDDFDGAWGVYDEPFLSFAADTLNKCKGPFVAGIFTLSSHNPFSVPKKYEFRFPRGTLPIHESIGYSDFAISQFIAKASGMPWFNNTLFVITGDHTSLSDQPQYDNVLGRYRVPILIFDPSGGLPQVGRDKVIQHTDITPTLLDLVGATPQIPHLFGWSVFDPQFKGRFIQEEYGYWYHWDSWSLIQLGEDDNTRIFPVKVKVQTEDVAPGTTDQVHVLKAARQYFNNGLINNNWSK